MLEIEEVKEQVENFLTDTQDARFLSEKCRDYYDNKQWTEAEARKLEARNQAPVVVNRIRPKVEGLIGLYNLRKSDPKAYPRTQKHEKASHVITDALRFVADNNNFDDTRLDVAEEFFVEGYAGAIVEVKQKGDKEPEIHIRRIPWDRIYYDPHSRAKDFSDARYMGIIMWMSKEEVKEKFPKADVDDLLQGAQHYEDQTFEDRPRWIDRQRERIRLALHFYIHKSQWHMCIFTDGMFMVKPQPSPFLDEDGDPENPMELVSGNIDRDNQRYGEVRSFLDLQDEINHRRSKMLHLLNQRQTHGRKGAVNDKSALKRELAKPDGHVEWEGEEWGKDFGVIDTQQMQRGQLEIYLDSKNEIDAISYNAQLSGQRQGDLSGKAIDRLQQAGAIELNRQFALLAGWEKRIYRQIWARVKQFWNEEKWIRVTDDQDNLRWVGLNSQLTAQTFLEETINDESRPLTERRQAAAAYTFMVQNNDPRLNQIIGVSNPVSELDVDIILDQSFDVINIQQEQFQMLAEFARGSDQIDIIELIELSQLRGKEELIEKIERRRQQAVQAASGEAEMDAAEKQAKTAKTAAQARLTQAETTQKNIENLLLINDPERVNSVSV